MLWFEHPSYVSVAKQVLTILKGKRARLRGIPEIVFLCGGKKSPQRERLNDYLVKNGTWLTFYAEDVFLSLMDSEPNANALEIERDLASLANA